MSEAIIRTLRRDDYPALIDLVRRNVVSSAEARFRAANKDAFPA